MWSLLLSEEVLARRVSVGPALHQIPFQPPDCFRRTKPALVYASTHYENHHINDSTGNDIHPRVIRIYLDDDYHPSLIVYSGVVRNESSMKGNEVYCWDKNTKRKKGTKRKRME
eukprot:6198050-Pleurochrysis_carterae.AAC.1